jgi:hypothetical protein
MNKSLHIRASEMPMLELVISIGIFSVISVFLLQLFLSADTLEKKAVDLSKATIQAETIAEGIKGCDTMEEACRLLHVTPLKNSTYEIRYDANWHVTSKDTKYGAAILPDVIETEYGIRTKVLITMFRIGENRETKIIYQLPIERYQAK